MTHRERQLIEDLHRELYGHGNRTYPSHTDLHDLYDKLARVGLLPLAASPRKEIK